MEYGEREVVEALDDAVAELRAYRERFDADRPGEVSLLEAGDGDIGEVWEALSDRKTVRKRADLLEAALRDGPASGDVVGRADD